MPLQNTPEEEIEHVRLGDLFPPGHVFALHLPLRTLTHLHQVPDVPYPHLLAQVQFTDREFDLVRPLYQHYPQFVPYEVMLTSFNRGFGQVNERSITKTRQRLEAARQEEGLWDVELRAMRNVMTRTRAKLHEVGLEVVTMLATGYLLMKYGPSGGKEG
jgi:hypothetical protein